jgi:hypothetical protein
MSLCVPATMRTDLLPNTFLKSILQWTNFCDLAMCPNSLTQVYTIWFIVELTSSHTVHNVYNFKPFGKLWFYPASWAHLSLYSVFKTVIINNNINHTKTIVTILTAFEFLDLKLSSFWPQY